MSRLAAYLDVKKGNVGHNIDTNDICNKGTYASLSYIHNLGDQAPKVPAELAVCLVCASTVM